MKLLAVALAGLVALIAASPVETAPIAVAASKYNNDGFRTYKCDSGTIVLSCYPSGTCSFVEKCSNKCVSDREGAGCTDPTISTAVEDRAVGGPSAKHMNDDTITYHCTRDEWILACPAIGACATIEFCLVKCIENQRGAECSPQALEKRDVNSEVNAEDEKSYECSKDRTGVLICQFGFCSTDHYSKKGWKCRDKCACCKKANLFARDSDEFDDTEIPTPNTVHPKSLDTAGDDNQALAVVDSDTLASRADPCAPGTYTCMASTSTGTAWIMVCDYKGTWQYSADCGDLKCLAQSNGAAHCWNPGKEWDSALSAVSRRGESPDFVTPSLDGVCQTGLYSCSYNPITNEAWIIVCDANEAWQWLRSCGQNQKCSVSPPGSGNVFCTPLKTLGAREGEDEVPSDAAAALDCRPGSFACTWRDETQSSWVITCDQSGHRWLWSSNCGRGQICDQSAGDGTAHCIPGQQLGFEARQDPEAAASTLATVTVGVTASAKA